jgi:hypothetical protein
MNIETPLYMWYYELTGFCGKRNYLLMHIRYLERALYAKENT